MAQSAQTLPAGQPIEMLDGKVLLYPGDCRDSIRALADNSVDAVVTDPPYALVSIQKRFGGANAKATKDGDVYARASAGFMGKQWDTGEVAFATEFWEQVFRVLKPGAHVVAFSGTRTYHRMTCAIEDAGFEIRDQLAWVYGAGFPKSHNVSRKLDDIRCACSRCETAEPVLQHDLRSLRDADLSSQEPGGSAGGEVLLEGLPQQGSHSAIDGAESEERVAAREQPSMEGRSDATEAARQLCVGAVCESTSTSSLDGQAGRIHHGASSGDGGVGGSSTDANGSRAPCGPQTAEQPKVQSGTVAGQSQSQDGGAWPRCDGCGKPIIPDGIGTALKPAWEPICLARKPIIGTVAANVLEHGTGALNVDGCRVGDEVRFNPSAGNQRDGVAHNANILSGTDPNAEGRTAAGRWPANIIHDGSYEVVAAFPDAPGQQRAVGPQFGDKDSVNVFGDYGPRQDFSPRADSGSAARFFYSAKADANDRIGSKHPTVKPVDLMQWLCRLVTPPGGTILDPFAGSGSTGEAAWREGFRSILCEREEEYQADIQERMRLANAGPMSRRQRIASRKAVVANDNDLFARSA